MKTTLTALAMTLALASPALADTMSVAIQVDSNPVQFYNNVPGYVGVSTGPWLVSTQEASHGFELNAITNVASILNVWVTAQGFTDPYTGWSALQYMNWTLPSGWNVAERVYTDPANGAFSGNLLDSAIFTMALPFPGQVEYYPLTLGTPYSVSVWYTVTSVASPTAVEYTGDINLGHNTPTPVPGPIVGVGLPGLIGGALGLWALLRRRMRRESDANSIAVVA
jgi:hypothetical protein